MSPAFRGVRAPAPRGPAAKFDGRVEVADGAVRAPAIRRKRGVDLAGPAPLTCLAVFAWSPVSPVGTRITAEQSGQTTVDPGADSLASISVLHCGHLIVRLMSEKGLYHRAHLVRQPQRARHGRGVGLPLPRDVERRAVIDRRP